MILPPVFVYTVPFFFAERFPPMSYFPLHPARSINELTALNSTLRAELRFFFDCIVELDDFLDSPYAHLRYVTEHLRPFAAVIDACIPSTVTSRATMPDGRVEELAPFVMRYMERVVRELPLLPFLVSSSRV